MYKPNERMRKMAYEEKYKKPEQPHNLILEGRRRLSVSGVEDVENFDEREVVITTICGTLIVKGSELHIEKLSIDGGDFILEGDVESMTYEAREREKGSIWSRLFK
jgi:sporulation protein YabP